MAANGSGVTVGARTNGVGGVIVGMLLPRVDDRDDPFCELLDIHLYERR